MTQNTILELMKIHMLDYEIILEAISAHMPDSMYIQMFNGEDFVFVWVNEAKARKHSLRPEQMIGLSDKHFMSPEEAAISHADNMRAYHGEIICDRIEKIMRPNGEVSYVSVSKSQFADKIGNAFGIMGISKDITERMKIEELVKTDIGSVIHEFTSTTLAHGELYRYLITALEHGKIEKSCNILARMKEEQVNIRERLLMSRLRVSQLGVEKPKKPETETSFDLRIIFNEIVSKYQKTMREKGIALDDFMGLIPEGSYILKTIKEWVYYAIDNAFSNEIKYGGEKLTRMTFGAEADYDNNQLLINISSDGEKIDEDFAKNKLFKKGQRAQETSHLEGTGFGLNTSRDYMRELGGEMIYVPEIRGEWMAFIIILPLSIVQFPPE